LVAVVEAVALVVDLEGGFMAADSVADLAVADSLEEFSGGW
jgi:hypothetical protein